MGLGHSKQKHVLKPSPFSGLVEKTVKVCTENNKALLRSCLINDTGVLTSCLESGTNLSSPYKGIPLIFSATLALLNDNDFDRFKENWKLITDNFKENIPIVKNVKLTVTNFTAHSHDRRSTCYPVVYIDNLSAELIETQYKYHKSMSLGLISDSNLRKALGVIISKIENSLKEMTRDSDKYVADIYEGTATKQMVGVIRKNAKYIIDNINNVEKLFDDSISYGTYQDRFSQDYDMDSDVPYAAVADDVKATVTAIDVSVNKQKEPFK